MTFRLDDQVVIVNPQTLGIDSFVDLPGVVMDVLNDCGLDIAIVETKTSDLYEVPMTSLRAL